MGTPLKRILLISLNAMILKCSGQQGFLSLEGYKRDRAEETTYIYNARLFMPMMMKAYLIAS